MLITFETSNADAAHDNAVILYPSRKTSIMIHKPMKHQTRVNYGSFSHNTKIFFFSFPLDFCRNLNFLKSHLSHVKVSSVFIRLSLYLFLYFTKTVKAVIKMWWILNEASIECWKYKTSWKIIDIAWKKRPSDIWILFKLLLLGFLNFYHSIILSLFTYTYLFAFFWKINCLKLLAFDGD